MIALETEASIPIAMSGYRILSGRCEACQGRYRESQIPVCVRRERLRKLQIGVGAVVTQSALFHDTQWHELENAAGYWLQGGSVQKPDAIGLLRLDAAGQQSRKYEPQQ